MEDRMGTQKTCVDCAVCGCADGSESYPVFCATRALPDDVRDEVNELYRSGIAGEVMGAAAVASSRAFSEVLCRIEETLLFASEKGSQKLGVAVCSGLMREGRTFARIARHQGFEVYGIACKVGAVKRSEFDAVESCCDYGTVSCNPLLQARLLNEAETDLNVVIGLCVGHDSLFYRASDALCTTLVVKDRALANNPAAALAAADSVSPYGRMLK